MSEDELLPRVALFNALRGSQPGKGPMSPDEYRAALATLGLTQVAGAKLLGVDERTSRRWATGEREIPSPAYRFLRYLIATGKSGEYAMKRLES